MVMDSGQSLLLIYTGGTESDFYRMVRAALTKPGPCGLPTVYDDGRVEYPRGDPPDIEGYGRAERTEFPTSLARLPMACPDSHGPGWSGCR